MFLIKRKLIIENNLKFVENIFHEDELFTPLHLLLPKESSIEDGRFTYDILEKGQLLQAITYWQE